MQQCLWLFFYQFWENFSFVHILPKELLAGVVGSERLAVVSEQQATVDTSLPFLLQVAMLMFPVAACNDSAE